MLLLAGLLSALAGGVSWLAALGTLRRTGGARVRNFRGIEVAVAGGTVLLFGVLVSQLALAAVALGRPISIEVPDFLSPSAIPATFLSVDNAGLLMLILGFFALGAADDLIGGEGTKGGRGHLGALRRGVLTGGAVKALGGIALSFVVSALWELRPLEAALDAALIAATANLLNLLDLRPGRATKVFILAWIALAAALYSSPWIAASAGVFGGAVVWLGFDLRERGVLGDSGANLLGAVLGGGMVLGLDTVTRAAILGVVLLLTISSERWSFTRIIERVPPLRWLDRIGAKTPFQ